MIKRDQAKLTVSVVSWWDFTTLEDFGNENGEDDSDRRSEKNSNQDITPVVLVIANSRVGDPSGSEEQSELDNWDNQSTEQRLVESSTQIERNVPSNEEAKSRMPRVEREHRFVN